MSIDKPSSAEDKYFKKADLERLARLRKQLDKERDQQRVANEQQEHWMRCPKCGGEMEEVLFRHIMVDRCTRCGYVGFDKGELDLLLGQEVPVLSKIGDEIKRVFQFDWERE